MAEAENPNEIVIESLNEYLAEIQEMRKRIRTEEGEEPDPQHFFFRGQANVNWDVVPGIFRDDLLSFESELIQSAYLRNPDEFSLMGSDFARLAKLQHYGLPTRLLDVTTNPLVAMYFACQEHSESVLDANENEMLTQTDGAVFYRRTYCRSYNDLAIKVISYLSNFDLRGETSLNTFLTELEELGIYTHKAAEECRSQRFRSLIDMLQHSYFVLSSMDNERLIRQSGAFLIAGQYNISVANEHIGKSIIQRATGSLRDEFDEFVFRIPAEKKTEIIGELDFYNINEGSLFPELEHQMTYIKRTQTGRTLQTFGHFIKYVPDESLRLPPTFKEEEPSIEETTVLFESVLSTCVPQELIQPCLDILLSNLAIDWQRRENIQSKMRLELTKSLECTPRYNRDSAKTKAQEIVDSILKKLQ